MNKYGQNTYVHFVENAENNNFLSKWDILPFPNVISSKGIWEPVHFPASGKGNGHDGCGPVHSMRNCK